MLILSKRLSMVCIHPILELAYHIQRHELCTFFWLHIIFHKTLVIIIQQKQAIIVIDAACSTNKNVSTRVHVYDRMCVCVSMDVDACTCVSVCAVYLRNTPLDD